MILLRPKYEISVVIPTRDDDERLHMVLLGFTEQTHSEFDIHVVNDSGGPITQQVVKRFQNKLDIHYHYYQGVGQFHAGSARNFGMSNCAGQRVLFSDSDVVPDRNVVAEHYKYGNKRVAGLGIRRCVPRVVVENVLFPQLKRGYFDVRNIEKYSFFGDPRSVDPAIRPMFFRHIYQEDPTDQELATCAKHWGFQAEHMKLIGLWKAWNCWSFNLSVPNAGMTFDPAFDGSYGGEDIELGLRLVANGYRLILNPRSITYHLDHPLRVARGQEQFDIFKERLLRVVASIK